jgi:hypothetical protein
VSGYRLKKKARNAIWFFFDVAPWGYERPGVMNNPSCRMLSLASLTNGIDSWRGSLLRYSLGARLIAGEANF